MIAWGINALNHGSSLSVFENDRLVSFNQCKGNHLDKEIVHHAFNKGGPVKVYWYENPWIKKYRQLVAGQWHRVFDLDDMPRQYLKSLGIDYSELIYTSHHASHAAAGYYTSPFDHCAIVVLDAIGEFESATIWEGHKNAMTKIWSRSYPNSLGLFYSAFTQYLGYLPVVEEYKLQEDSHLGNPYRFKNQVERLFDGTVRLTKNLHKGLRDYDIKINNQQDRYDLAAAVQYVFEEQVDTVMMIAKNRIGSDNLVYMGGCAMNSRYNKKLYDRWKRIWSLPDPGDGSSSIGSVLFNTKQRISVDLGIVKHLEIRV